MRKTTYAMLSPEQQALLNAAATTMENAYNPYSNFYVGAALQTPEGFITTGTNFENAAYGSTICAERAALVRANSIGQRTFTLLAIIARGEKFETTKVTAPCGSCRQNLYEMAQLSGIDLEVIMSTTNKKKVVIATIEELLPLGFGPKDLGVDLERYRR